MKATFCEMPRPAPPDEAEVYLRMRDLLVRAHCADKRPAHRCCGVISIARDHVTFQCPRCGDARQVIVGDA